MTLKKIFDFIFALILIGVLSTPMIFITIIIRINSEGGALYWSNRIGKGTSVFCMPKFRTMVQGTPQVASHLIDNPNSYYTSIGRFLRKTSLDELPQLWSVLKGDMSFVGPRPALFNQFDLIELRTKKGISEINPGITGWAQVNGRDENSISDKVIYDEEYLKRASFSFDIYIIWLTILKVIKKDGVSH